MAINVKSTKDQIFKAYQDAEKSKKEAEVKLLNAQKEAQNAQNEAEKAKKQLEALKLQMQSVKPLSEQMNGTALPFINQQKINANTVEGILNVFDEIEKGLGNAISEISIQMSIEANALSELRKKTNETALELKSLYDLEMFDDILFKLINDYEDAEKTFAESAEKRQKDFEEEISNLQKNWQKEQSKYNNHIFERNEKTDKNYQREIRTHQYDLEHARNLEKDLYQQKKKQLQAELDELKEIQQLTWDEKEKLLKEKEEELAKYKKDFEEFPEKLEKEIKKAEAEAKGIIEKDAKVKHDLVNKEMEARNKMYEMRVNALNTNIENQKVQIEKLNDQLAIALKQAQELAVKAIEGTSNLDKFNAVREIATEMAKNQPKTK
ncbi:MAG: hypothetical protein EAZ85_09210 [Bacteroidetes bacterium]|nr:MAG: hypothetical protein EAZ85_09210 [Bacteroidota bacterium]TAG88265.1 MAG: hypothetical protein EAZ20_08865 [Bacteroidota bacterium]